MIREDQHFVLDSWEFNFMHIQYENVSSII